MAKQVLDPSDISRTNQEVLDDVAATWLTLDHTEGVRGHKRTGLSVKLDGSEDHMITREAGEFWKECQMPLRRRDACDAVAQRFETSSAPCFETVRDLLEHPSRGLGFGEFGEGYEIEEAEEDGECVYEQAGEARAADAEELADAQRMLEEVAPTAEIVALAAEAADPEEAFWLRRGSSPHSAGFQARV